MCVFQRKLENLSKWCPKGALDITNSGIHSLTDPSKGISDVMRVLTKTESIILSFGPNFIPPPEPISNKEVEVVFKNFANSVRKLYNNFDKITRIK
jgi:hypothetical protein